MKRILTAILVLGTMVATTGCYSENTNQLKRIADKIDMSDSARNARMDKFMDSVNKSNKVKVDSIFLLFNKSMDFSSNGKSDSCKKYLKIMQEYSRKK